MSNQTPDMKRLTPADPVDKETLQRLGELQTARLQIADRLLDLEQEKVGLIVAARDVKREVDRTFEKILVDRGLPPSARVEIDGQTGRIIPVGVGPRVPGDPPATPADQVPTDPAPAPPTDG